VAEPEAAQKTSRPSILTSQGSHERVERKRKMTGWNAKLKRRVSKLEGVP